jgi:hypothetical protein
MLERRGSYAMRMLTYAREERHLLAIRPQSEDAACWGGVC